MVCKSHGVQESSGEGWPLGNQGAGCSCWKGRWGPVLRGWGGNSIPLHLVGPRPRLWER